ncbi:hypothetical protein ACF0H5_014825 [Mactra antiquata]
MSFWEETILLINSIETCNRTGQEVLKKWSELKSKTKLKELKHRNDMKLTGGGPHPPALESWEEKIINVLSPSLIDGIDGEDFCTQKDVWIMGDSIPFWAGKRAEATGKPNLRTVKRISLLGVRGLGWTGFRHSYEGNVILSTPPKIIAIHLGGNDLHNLTICKIKNCITSELKYLRTAFPSATLIWIDILPRKE